MKITVLSMLILAAMTDLAHPQEPPDTKEVGRYVLLNATAIVTVLEPNRKPKPVFADEKVPLVLKIDTISGKTWKLSVGVENGKSFNEWVPISDH